MQITQLTRADYDQIVGHIEEFWGSDRTLARTELYDQIILTTS
jgi:hypothetical protein